MKTYVVGYSLEAPLEGASNEYHNIHFLGEKRKISLYFSVEKKTNHLMQSYDNPSHAE